MNKQNHSRPRVVFIRHTPTHTHSTCPTMSLVGPLPFARTLFRDGGGGGDESLNALDGGPADLLLRPPGAPRSPD